ncbi:hypothetical protein [Dyadobacter frigoris]|uniref:Recombinase domain-containing protein n=1 Tax=Dyadobacter frigoris TaxID=2576211 RepID=A0A4U6CX54_9BACT|nr:hypothetical protein [Dyadobacter frigoris]TKT89332.1 hypothetical protein FDK13_23560 [Dyadobacter frigoris]GLU55533.1 hypothetical protein Dfri01_49940 [Dyadobacter frigoris]
MNDIDKTDPVFLTLCSETLKNLINQNSRKETVRQILEIKFEAKMSEEDYIHYMFFKALSEMYKAGLEEGESHEESEVVTDSNQEKSVVYFRARNSKRSIPADNFAMKLAPVLKEIRQAGPITLLEIANKLTELGIKTMEGGKWHPATVRSLENRIIKVTNKTAEWNMSPKGNSNR